jgi:transcriptional regulator with XRE-family HTH domain
MTDGWPAYLRSAMTARGLTQANLARALGVNDSLVSRWLTGRNTTDVRYLRKLAPLLKVPVVELLVAAGHLDAAEAKVPPPKPAEPPRPVTVEEFVRANIPPGRQDAALAMLRALINEDRPATGDRKIG